MKWQPLIIIFRKTPNGHYETMEQMEHLNLGWVEMTKIKGNAGDFEQ